MYYFSGDYILKKLTLLITSLFFVISAYAENEPTACPSLDSIAQSLAINDVISNNNHSFKIEKNDAAFGTVYKWDFRMSQIVASTKQEALTKAIETIRSSTLKPIVSNNLSSDWSYFISECISIDNSYAVSHMGSYL